MPGSLSVMSQAWRIKAIIGPVSALRAAGRFIVTISTRPRRSRSACGGPSPGRSLVSTAPVVVMAPIPSLGRPERLAQNSNTFYFRPMALNFADLFEHAVDAFAERTAVACGDRQITYRELEERSNRLAHHLAGLGVGPGDHVGLYARNSIEAVETLIASCKLRAAAVNINYRYVENELQYMFADSDLTALVYDRRLAPVVAGAAPAAPGLRGLVEIDDGTGASPGAGRARHGPASHRLQRRAGGRLAGARLPGAQRR